VKVLVVGGGTAGLISALILKKRLNISVDVVHSPNIGIIGVGEGSTEHFNEFMQLMGWDFHTIIKECDATFKSGIMFEGWSKKPYLHSIGGPFASKAGQYPFVTATAIQNGLDALTSPLPWNNKIPSYALNRNSETPYYQYHFNTFKLNEFLIKEAKKLKINIIEDEIVDITLSDDGSIDYINGKKLLYKYDFYIDSTGFKRILMNKLEVKWVSFGKYLKMKAALTFPTEDTEEYNAWTLSKAMDNGWLFRIPVWGRHGNGYIYDSDYISADEAKKEIDILYNKDIEIKKEFKFDAGSLEKIWVKNCVAVGLSGVFVEPLEASSIGTTIQQMFLLMHKIIGYDEKTIESYNKSMSSIIENIRDFIVLHYITNKDNTDFWKDISKLELPDSLSNKLELWNNKIPIQEDFTGSSGYSLFRADNFIFIMHGLRILNYENINTELNGIDPLIKIEAFNILNRYKDEQLAMDSIGHKEFINKVRLMN